MLVLAVPPAGSATSLASERRSLGGDEDAALAHSQLVTLAGRQIRAGVSPWLWLLAAGGAEIAWSQSIRPSSGFTRPLPTLLCLLLAIAAIYPLTRAMRDLPVGTAYAVFTAIGSVGAVGLGIVISGDPVGPARLLAIALIVSRRSTRVCSCAPSAIPTEIRHLHRELPRPVLS